MLAHVRSSNCQAAPLPAPLTAHIHWAHAVLDAVGSVPALLHHCSRGGERGRGGGSSVRSVPGGGAWQEDRSQATARMHATPHLRQAAWSTCNAAARQRHAEGTVGVSVQLRAKAEAAVAEEAQRKDGLLEAPCIVVVALLCWVGKGRGEVRMAGWQADARRPALLPTEAVPARQHSLAVPARHSPVPHSTLALTYPKHLLPPPTPPGCPPSHRGTC